MNDKSNIFISSGIFWFWDNPWWDYLNLLSLDSSIKGIQILCSVDDMSMPLPSMDITEYLSEHFEIILHPFFINTSGWYKNPRVVKRLDEINLWADKANVKRVIFHCDLFKSEPLKIDLLINIFKKKKILIENTGKMDSYGNRIDQVIDLLKSSNQLYLAIDMAHLSEAEDYNFDNWLSNELICERIDCVHISSSNRNNKGNMLNLPDEIALANHIPGFLRSEEISSNHKEYLAKYPLIMEGCLPKGDLGKKFLQDEIEYLNKWTENNKEN